MAMSLEQADAILAAAGFEAPQKHLEKNDKTKETIQVGSKPRKQTKKNKKIT